MSQTHGNKKQRFTCPQCARSYSRKHDMERHIDIAHTPSDEKPYKCELCQFVFSSEEKLRVHKDDHQHTELPFLCEICNKGFKSKNTWKRHMRAHIDPTPHMCHVCNRKFGREHDMYRHTVRMHSKERTYQCDLCSSKFAWFSDLTIHKRRHNAMRIMKKQKEGKVTLKKTFPRKSKRNLSADKGDKSGSDLLACRICYQSFKTFSSLQLHTCDVEISSEDEVLNIIEDRVGLNTADINRGPLQAHAYSAKSSSENYNKERESFQGMDVSENVVSNDNCSEVSKFKHKSDQSSETDKLSIIETTSSTINQEKENPQTDSIITKNRESETSVLPDFSEMETESKTRSNVSNTNIDESVDAELSFINTADKTMPGADKTKPGAQSEISEFNSEVVLEDVEPEQESDIVSANSKSNVDETTETNTKLFKCKVCLNAFSKFSTFQLHLCKEYAEEESEKTDKNTSKTKEVVTQRAKHQKPFPVRLRLSRRGRRKKTQDQNRDSFTCKECSKIFPGISQLKEHSLNEHEETVLSCSVCQKVFRKKSKLDFHVLSHESIQPHQCIHCHKKFKHKRDLDRHEKQHRDENAKLKCQFCSKLFYRKNDLDRHIENVHPVQAPYRCEMCKAGFKSTKQLKRHKLDHSKTHPYNCWICDRGLRTAQNLKRHLQLHSDERPFSCSVCTKGFNRRHDMLQHKRIHSTERLGCTLCAAKFASEDSLKKHYKRKHTDQLPNKCDQYHDFDI